MNGNLSEFTNKTKEKMSEVLGCEEYVKPIANSLGKDWVNSFKKFTNMRDLDKIVKRVQARTVGVKLRNPAEHENKKTAKVSNDLELEH